MEFSVNEQEHGLNAASFLQKRIPAASSGYINQLIKKNKVTRDEQPLAGDDLLHQGELIHLPNSARLQQLCETDIPEREDLKILYESREILVVEKPAGLAVHSSRGHEKLNLTASVVGLLTERGEHFHCAPIHRLDLETSGPVLFGKGKKACSELGKMFMQQRVEKHYLAMVAGKIRSSGVIRCELSAKGKKKLSVTEYHVRACYDHASLLEMRLLTGRQHQIRRQLAAMGHPVLGDRRYGGLCPTALNRMFLHCCLLSFTDPFSGIQLDIRIQLPEELSQFNLSQVTTCLTENDI